MPVVNPYEAKSQSSEASLSERRFTKGDIYRAQASAFKEGVKAQQALVDELCEALKSLIASYSFHCPEASSESEAIKKARKVLTKADSKGTPNICEVKG